MKKYLPTLVITLIASALVHAGVQLLLPAFADQSERVVPTSGIYTGPQYAQKIGDFARSVSTANKGSSAPANVGGNPVDGLEWLDDSGSVWLKKRYVNGGWAIEAAYDPADSSYVGVIGGGLGSIASASIVDLGSVPQANVTITGTTTINSLGSSSLDGVVKIIRFADALTLTWSSALPVPCGVDLVTAANDRAIVTHLGSGNWEITSYQRANGIPVDCAAVAKIEYGIFDQVPANHVAGYGQALSRASYPAYLAKVTRAQTGTRTSGNATIASVANTAGLGAGMPVEGTGIGSSCTIASVTSNSITLNSSACVTSSGTSTVTAFLKGYGTGGSTSTVGVEDCRGRVMAGRDRNDPGSFANRLTSSYFGADSSVFNVSGASNESVTMALGNLIQHTHNNVLNQNPHKHATNGLQITGSAGTFQFAPGGNLAINPDTGTALADVSITNAAAGSASPTPMRTVMPTLIADCVVRVTP